MTRSPAMIDLLRALGRFAAPLVLLVGCAPSTSSEGAEARPQSVELALEYSKEVQISPEQEEILRAALAEGRDVTYEEYLLAVQNTVDCMRSAGVTVDDLAPGGGGEVSVVFYATADTEAAAFAAQDQCTRSHSEFVSFAYLTRGAALERRDSTIATYLPAMISCLREQGVIIADDATVEEILSANVEQQENTGAPDNCVQITGLQVALDQL